MIVAMRKARVERDEFIGFCFGVLVKVLKIEDRKRRFFVGGVDWFCFWQDEKKTLFFFFRGRKSSK